MSFLFRIQPECSYGAPLQSVCDWLCSVSAIGSKLLMCVCAGATGATVVPVAQKARASLFHRAAAHSLAAPRASAPLPVSCAPTIASAVPAALPAGEAPAMAEMASLAPLSGGAGGIGFAGGSGGFLSPGTGTGVGGGGGGGGSGPYLPPTVPTPGGGHGSVPEPGTWTMMISGFGMIGAGVRWQRRQEI